MIDAPYDIDQLIRSLPTCDIIVDDGMDVAPYKCDNRAFKFCHTCKQGLCYYHSERGHKCELTTDERLNTGKETLRW